MIAVNNVSLRFGKRTLFENVNLKFVPGNCYGLIGANGAGKSTFLKLLSGEIETTTGEISIGKGERLSILKQDHNIYNDYKVLDVVIMGNKRLYEIIEEKNALYTKENFTDKDGIKLGELESEFVDLNGWQAESDAAILLTGLGVDLKYHEELMKNIPTKEKVKVLLAQALFGNPDILLLDEPTNGLDIDAKMWLEEFLIDFQNTIIVVSHDRHFLNKVCTHIVDIDYEKITLFVGNYDFWYKSSELIQKQMKDSNKKKEEKIKELQDFIARFSANSTLAKYDRGVRWDSEELDVKGQQWKSAYLPVWLYSYLEKKNNKNLLHYVAVNARTKETMGSVPVHMPKLFAVSTLVEALGILATLFTFYKIADGDSWWPWLFLLSGFIYFLVIYNKYRNTGARHSHETETKSNMKNLRSEDHFIRHKTHLSNSSMDGANNKKVSGTTRNKNLVNDIINRI